MLDEKSWTQWLLTVQQLTKFIKYTVRSVCSTLRTWRLVKPLGTFKSRVLRCIIQGALKQQNCNLLGADHCTDSKRKILSHLTCHLRRLLLLLVELLTVGTECWSNAAVHQIDVLLLLLWLPKIQNLPSWLYVNDDLFCPKLLCKLYCFLKASRIWWQAHLTESIYSFTAFSHCPVAEVFIKAYESG